MKRIVKVWFSNERIFIETDDAQVSSRPLEAFPILKDASPQQRDKFEISSFGDSLRWREIDEDIHISSFFEVNEPKDNETGRLFARFPFLNVSEVARIMGMNKSLLSKYIYGIKIPSPARMESIKETLRDFGRQLSEI